MRLTNFSAHLYGSHDRAYLLELETHTNPPSLLLPPPLPSSLLSFHPSFLLPSLFFVRTMRKVINRGGVRGEYLGSDAPKVGVGGLSNEIKQTQRPSAEQIK